MRSPAEFLEGAQRIRAAVGVDDGALRLLVPVGPLKEVESSRLPASLRADRSVPIPDIPITQ
jgi:hypothetical protein